ncbi:MAG: enoyl-CoA hydratase/isomerase family protein [Alphaproteobacteria bacterium]
MAWQYTTIERDGPIAIVRFDRKQNLNAFNQALIQELTEVARGFQDDLEVHGVVLTGAPQAFSAGADLKDAASWQVGELTDLERRQRFHAGVRLCKAWEELPQITVAAMERMAVGAGIAIGLACDWRVLDRDGFLYVPEMKIGLNLQWGALPRLITLVGPARAKRICLMCERMDAAGALDWGLVDELAETGKTVDVAKSMLQAALAHPAATVRLVKEAVNATANALHRATSYADADQSQLTAAFAGARSARDDFKR